MRYFKKEILSNRLWLKSTGAAVTWENAGDDTGILATDNQAIIDELDGAVAKGIGGVVQIDEAEYQDTKKKASVNPSLLNSVRDRFSLSGLSLPAPSNPGALVAAVNPPPLRDGRLIDIPKETPDPISITTEFVRPKTSKPFFKKTSG